MSSMVSNLVIYLVSFFVIWMGAGLIVSSVIELSERLRLPAFLISFVVLGLMTSMPEVAVGLSAISSGTPSIFVGNLLGGVPIIFLFIIPFLAILGGGIKLSHNFGQSNIWLAIACSLSPFVVVLDHKITNYEGWFLVGIYLVVVYLLYVKKGLKKPKIDLLSLERYSFFDL